MADVITVEHLTVAFPAKEGTGEVVRDVSLAIGAGERVGLVGESGSGKSLTARAIMRLIPPPGRVTNGTVCFDGAELGAKSALAKWRGTKIAMITQDPLSSLNPLVKHRHPDHRDAPLPPPPAPGRGKGQGGRSCCARSASPTRGAR